MFTNLFTAVELAGPAPTVTTAESAGPAPSRQRRCPASINIHGYESGTSLAGPAPNHRLHPKHHLRPTCGYESGWSCSKSSPVSHNEETGPASLRLC